MAPLPYLCVGEPVVSVLDATDHSAKLRCSDPNDPEMSATTAHLYPGSPHASCRLRTLPRIQGNSPRTCCYLLPYLLWLHPFNRWDQRHYVSRLSICLCVHTYMHAWVEALSNRLAINFCLTLRLCDYALSIVTLTLIGHITCGAWVCGLLLSTGNIDIVSPAKKAELIQMPCELGLPQGTIFIWRV